MIRRGIVVKRQKIFRIVIRDRVKRCKFSLKGFRLSDGERHLKIFSAVFVYRDKINFAFLLFADVDLISSSV